MTTEPDLATVPPGWNARAWHDLCLTRATNLAPPWVRQLYRDRAAAVLVKHGPFTDDALAVVLPPAVEVSIRRHNTGGDIE